MAADWLKNGHVAAMCFNDSAALTCLSNDFGYESVFACPLVMHSKAGDLLFAISSSGRSNNIKFAISEARLSDVNVITLSGFNPNNPLRRSGDVNFYVPSNKYGVVEICHLAILHHLLDRLINESR